jgi:hypothetical protein
MRALLALHGRRGLRRQNRIAAVLTENASDANLFEISDCQEDELRLA